MPTIITIIIAVVAFIVAAVITRFLTISSLTKDADSKIGSAETRAREIIDDALKKRQRKDDLNYNAMRKECYPRKKL